MRPFDRNRNWKRYRRSTVRRTIDPRSRPHDHSDGVAGADAPRPATRPAGRASASSPSSSTAPVRSGRCTSPTWGPRSSRSRIRAPAATSVALHPARADRARTACSSRRSTAASGRIALDLKSAAGRAVLERLVAIADAVVQQPARRPARAAGPDLRRRSSAINPAIVCVALTGYGRTGADATLPGYDALIQAESGWASLTGAPDGPPTKSGLSLADYIAGLTAALGLMVGAVRRPPDRSRPGRGHEPVRLGPRDAQLPGDLVPVAAGS